MTLNILLVDDHALFREGMRFVLQRLDASAVNIHEAGRLGDAVDLATQYRDELDLALLDINMPGSDGLESVNAFHLEFPDIPIVIVSGDDDVSQMEQVMQDGAMGYISKDSTSAVMLSALNLVLAGGIYVPPQLVQRSAQAGFDDDDIIGPPPAAEKARDENVDKITGTLTPRQMQVLRLLAHNLSNKEIAGRMHITEGTVKIHVAAIFQVLKVNSRASAVAAAHRIGLLKHNKR